MLKEMIMIPMPVMQIREDRDTSPSSGPQDTVALRGVLKPCSCYQDRHYPQRGWSQG